MGAPQRRRVVDTVADHRHDFTGVHQRVDDLVFLLGLHAREDAGAARDPGGAFRAQTREFSCINDQAVVMGDAGGLRHGVGPERMVAGDELEFDPGRLAFAYRGRSFGTRRIAKAQQPIDEVAFVFARARRKSPAPTCAGSPVVVKRPATASTRIP